MRGGRVAGTPLFLFLFALAVRVAVAAWLPARIVWPDGERYELVALSLYHGQGFGSLYLNSYSVPTQALLIAGVYEVFGQSYLALRLVCAVIGALSCLVGYFITRRLFGESVARVAAVLLALYPHLVYLSALFEYPQVLYILIVGLSFLYLLRYQDSQRTGDLVIAGGSLGLAILTVPTVLPFVPIAAAFIWFTSKAARWGRAMLFVAALALPVGSWAVRNYVAYDHMMLVNEGSGINFWMANNETYYESGKGAVVQVDCSSGLDKSRFCSDWLQVDLRMLRSNLSEAQVRLEWEKVGWQMGLQFVRESPLRFLRLTVRRFFSFWSPIPDALTTNPGSGGGARNLIAALAYTPVLILAIAGLLSTRSQWRRLLPVYGYFLIFMCVYSIFLPTTRYRLPLDFFLVIFAAVALDRLWRRLRPNAQRPNAQPSVARQ